MCKSACYMSSNVQHADRCSKGAVYCIKSMPAVRTCKARRPACACMQQEQAAGKYQRAIAGPVPESRLGGSLDFEMRLGCWNQLLMPCFKVEEVLATGLILQSQLAT